MQNVIETKKDDLSKVKKEQVVRRIICITLIYIFLIIGAISVLFPFYWMINTSLKSFNDYYSEFVPTFFPTHLAGENYIEIWKTIPLVTFMLNTLLVSIITTAIMVVISITAAFAFARLNFYGKNFVFTIYLATMMVPMELFTITNYATIVNANLRNTIVGIVFPSVMAVFYIYLLRQNFMQVPDQMYYAAKVDGCSDFKYMTNVLVPLSKPTIVSISILKFIECWNSYIWPKLVTTEENRYLISNGIQLIRKLGVGGRENIPAMMAAVVCVSLPLLIIFIIFRKQIMSGVSRSGLKG